MHHSHVVLAIVITSVSVIAVLGIVVVVSVRVRRHAFAGPLRDEWQGERIKTLRSQIEARYGGLSA